MLPANRLTLAIHIQSHSYQLLKWVADAVCKGFIPAEHAHQFANVCDAAYAWMEEHFFNLPTELRPDRQHLREFANFFATYVTSSFDIVVQPGTRLVSRCGCYCPLCSRLVNAPHLRTKRLSRRDKERANTLMANRLDMLAREEVISCQHDLADLARSEEFRRAAAFSAYGYWLIRRLEGDTDGKSVLALWREIAWSRAGSPVKNFKLQYQDFVEAEETLINALRRPAIP
jgi:hypothetical protein